MKRFMDENFLLQTETAVKLYHEYARDLPIFDYHCHLNPREIAENKRYRNITEIWLGCDHYKWRAMRNNGIDEKYITRNASDKQKFLKWAETVPACIGNPLYHWTHLELKRYFGIDDPLSTETAESIWEKCNEMLQDDAFTARSLIQRSNVKVVCTTDDPTDSLEYHKAIAESKDFDVRVLPAFRPDRAIRIEQSGFIEWIRRLEKVTGYSIRNFEDLKKALILRLEFFHEAGCRISDHGMDPFIYIEGSEEEASCILESALAGKEITAGEVGKYKTELLVFLGRQYARLGWTMQLHMGVLRNTNTRMMRSIGPDTGFDSIGDFSLAESLSRFLDRLDQSGGLPKTILFSINPRDNEVLAAIAGCFHESGIPGKIQHGPAWWFNDHRDGIEKQLLALANTGLLSRFVGMLTDSRSFLSYTRHEYFRRILCNILGNWVENGEAPNDMKLMGKMVQDICYNNAVNYFGIDT